MDRLGRLTWCGVPLLMCSLGTSACTDSPTPGLEGMESSASEPAPATSASGQVAPAEAAPRSAGDAQPAMSPTAAGQKNAAMSETASADPSVRAGTGGADDAPTAGNAIAPPAAGHTAASEPQTIPDASTAMEAATETKADAGTAVAAPSPPQEFLVPATGPCPGFTDGYVTFAPDGVERRVLLYMSDAAETRDGPLVLSWHSTLPNPEDATSWLGRSVIEEIKAQGGIVAAPATGYPGARRPWDSVPMGGDGDNDQRLMDEIVACAIEKVGIDVRRIHATGMSAGGLKTAQVSLRRSGYLASVVVYSGGFVEGDMPPDQDPSNHFAAMILYGGATDISPVDGINYTDASRRYLEALQRGGRFAFLCDHGGGHSVPRDSQASAWRFMQDHPYGVDPEPYAASLPDSFLRYCAL